jgi:hypothetical protein
MNKEPETYEELIRYKRCVDLTSHYELTEEELNKIYDFLTTYPTGIIVGNKTSLTLSVPYKTEITPIVINAKCTDFAIDGARVSNTVFTLIPHYVASSSSHYSGGSSSNNNNNNNNDNNNNNNNR